MLQKRRKITEKLTKWIVKRLRPLKTVREKEFKALLEEMDPCYTVPSTQTLRNKLIPQLDKEVMEKVRDDLKKVKDVALTSDGWSSKVNIFFYIYL